MPPSTDNSTDPTREDGSDEQWAQWEKTFRDARPVLPELALARIESVIQREANRVATTPPLPRVKRRIFFLLLVLSSALAIALWGIIHVHSTSGPSNRGGPTATVSLQDHYPLAVPIGPQLMAPDVPLIPMARYLQWVGNPASIRRTRAPTSRPQAVPALLAAAERYCIKNNDGWHALGLLEMRRAGNLPATIPTTPTPNTEDFHLDAAWQTMPLPSVNHIEFTDALFWLQSKSGPGWAGFWPTVFDFAWRESIVEQSPTAPQLPDLPREFPSSAGNRAHLDLLNEMGITRAQAALTVLTARSYEPLEELAIIDNWVTSAPMRARLREGYLSASHDLIERIFALRLAGRKAEADALVERAMHLRYLVEPKELAVVLARLGPDDAYRQLLGPLMENEVAFIENPPKFDETSRRSVSVATVEASSKSVQEGVTNYAGNIKLSAGPWRVSCDKLAVFQNARHGSLLTCTGNIHVRGVLGLFGASADEATFNTETGDLQLTGRVHLDGWQQDREMSSCTIVRTGEIHP